MTRVSAVGSPETVRQRLGEIVAETGADELILAAQIVRPRGAAAVVRARGTELRFPRPSPMANILGSPDPSALITGCRNAACRQRALTAEHQRAIRDPQNAPRHRPVTQAAIVHTHRAGPQ